MPATGYTLDVVVPCYQEEDALPETLPVMLSYFRQSVGRYSRFRILLVDDGSTDRTWSIIAGFAAEHSEVCGLKLSRNYGHQNAMLAGLSHADGDVVITMDCDLQDDISTVADMLSAFEGGSDLALGVRTDRAADSRFKRGTANGYYRLLSVMGVPTVVNHADYRLMSKQALRALLAHSEVNLFLRGIISTLGFKTSIIPYAREARKHGTTKYTMRKMIRLALDGITSFSVVPLRMISALGLLTFAGSLIASLWIFWVALFLPERTVPGWASTVLPTFLLGGVQLLSLGVIGEYIGKIYLETKQRPRFVVEKTLLKPVAGQVSLSA